MKEIIVDKAFVEPYFHGKKCKDYHMAVDIQNHMAFHFIGYFRKTDVTGNVQIINEKQNPYFKRLIDLRRPSESEPIMNYRRDIYLPITRIPCHKISNSLKKIIKSQDWNIDYSHSEMPNKIPDRETLEYYCEEDYPFFDSIEQWAYQFGLNQMLKDPNAAVVVLPINWDKEENEFYRPYSYVIPTRRVIDYSEGDYIVYDEDEGQTSEEITYTAKKLTIITNTQWFIVERNSKDEYSINLVLQHNLGYLPAFIIGGEPVKLSEKKTIV